MKEMKNILFIADPLENFKIYKDSTFAIMQEAQKRNYKIFACDTNNLFWKNDSKVSAQIKEIKLVEKTENQKKWFEEINNEIKVLADFDAIIMRKDPPFNNEYLYATYLLTQAEREGAKVFNSPQALREHSEKLSIMEFAEFLGPTLITSDKKEILEFHKTHKDIILKPLDGMGGTGIFRVKEDGLNLGSIFESFNKNSLMVQKFIPGIADGDKRILIINGQIIPYCLARIPQGNEVRGNLAVGGKGVAQELNGKDRKVAEKVAEKLSPRGLFLIGLDIIGNFITEINVTSPTCFQEIYNQTKFNVAEVFINQLETKI